MSTQTPRKIAFEDIRAGDRIRVEYDDPNGITYIQEGVAHELHYGNTWFTSNDGALGTGNDMATITLLHRPAPAEPKGLGAVMRTDEGIEYVSVNRKPGTPRWVEATTDDVFGELWPIRWVEFDLDLDSIEVLSEGIEVES